MTKNALREPDRSFFARIPLAFCAPSYTRSDRKPYLGCLSCHSHPICPCGAGHLPLEGKAAIREYHLLNRRCAALVNLSAPLLRHPERSRGIFIALPPYAHMRPHSNDTLVLPFSPFPHPRFTGLQKRSLHFGRDDRWKTGNLT